MTRAIYRRCKVCGDLHDIYNWPDNHRDPDWDTRSDLAAPNVVNSNLESIGGLNGLQSQIDGKYYTCARRMRAEYRAHGVIEVGDDANRLTKDYGKKRPKVTKEDVKPAVERAFHKVNLTTPTHIPKRRKSASSAKSA